MSTEARSGSAPRAGVLALQGGVAEHARILDGLGAHVVLVRRAEDVMGPDGPRLDALVLPGGESSTQDRLLRLLDLAEPLREAVSAGLPTLGTCAGLILLSREVLDPAPGQQSLGLLDVGVRRNAFGPQLVSTEAEFEVDAQGLAADSAEGIVRGALIRAPEIVSVGPGARAIVTHAGRVLGATSVAGQAAGDRAPLGTVTGISFHPEISGDPTLHRALLGLREHSVERATASDRARRIAGSSDTAAASAA